jgi:uncharacterized protein (TIGR03086 family)
MSEVCDRYGTIASGFTERLGGVRPERWLDPTPCADWCARDLVVHVVNTHRRVLATLDQSEPAVISADEPDRKLLLGWADARRGVLDALLDEARADQTVGGMFGEQPFSSLVGRLLCADTLIHTWDLARATGQDERLDPDAVAQALAFLLPIDEAIRRPGGFNPKIQPAPDADEQTKLLNFAGRAV